MITLTPAELVFLGIGGSVLMGLCVVENAAISARLICFVLGCIMFAVAVLAMVTN